MEDLIARLYPYNEDVDGFAHRAVDDAHNRPRRLATKEHLPDFPGRGSRESTPAESLDDSDDGNIIVEDFPYRPGLQLTFTHGPKAGPGFLLGTDPNCCDIVLPNLPSISRRHCYITFDVEGRLIVRDRSKNGTIVTYDDKGREKRRDFTWIIGGHARLTSYKKIVIELDERLQFRIVVPQPSPAYLSRYLEKVKNFLQNTTGSIGEADGALGIESTASTVAASGTRAAD